MNTLYFLGKNVKLLIINSIYWSQGEKMFKLHSEYTPTGDQPQAIEYLSSRNNERQEIPDFTWRYRFRKNIHNGKCNRKNTKTNARTRP